MKLPKTFLPDKCLDKKTEKLMEGYQDYTRREKMNGKILEAMLKLDMNSGVFYTALGISEFEQNNLPYEKLIYVGLVCANLGEKFYRYRFNYSSKGIGIRWLEIIDKKPKQRVAKLDKLVNEVWRYHKSQGNKVNTVICYQINPDKYSLKFNDALSKESLIDVIDNFYCKKFPYLGTKYNLFINKAIYKGLTEDEFLNSNLPLKHVEFKWKNRRGI